MGRKLVLGSGLIITISLVFIFNNCTDLNRLSGHSKTSSTLGGFWDPSLQQGTWRTDFDSTSSGSITSPLHLTPCAFNYAADPMVLMGAGATYVNENSSTLVTCDQVSKTYTTSNSSTSATNWPQDNFWVVSANNERSYGAEGTCSDAGSNTGPPNQSKQVKLPGQAMFGVNIGGGKAQLSIDTINFPNCVATPDKGKIPFLSVGAQTGRGNGNAALTYLNSGQRANLNFRLTLDSIAPAGVFSSTGKARVNNGYVFIEAQWDGMRHWVYVVLFSRGMTPGVSRSHWNWNIQESMWYPGAEINYISANLIASVCPEARGFTPLLNPVNGSWGDYSLDLNALFACFSWNTPFPKTPIPITGIHWAIEQTYGPNATAVSVQNLQLGE